MNALIAGLLNLALPFNPVNMLYRNAPTRPASRGFYSAPGPRTKGRRSASLKSRSNRRKARR